MKKIISIIISLVLVCTVFTPLSVVGQQDYSNFINYKAPKTRVYTDINGQKINLVYTATTTLIDKKYVHPEQRIDVYGTYDEYLDSEQTRYCYLYNTDILCLKAKTFEYDFGNEVDKSDKISKDAAIQSAKQYLLKEIGTSINDYTLQMAVYQQMGNYLVMYSRKIDGYFTDDCISVFMTHNGEIYSFSALYMERYKNLTKLNIDRTRLNVALNSVTNPNDICLTLDDNSGKLVPLAIKTQPPLEPAAPKMKFTTKKSRVRLKRYLLKFQRQLKIKPILFVENTKRVRPVNLLLKKR